VPRICCHATLRNLNVQLQLFIHVSRNNLHSLMFRYHEVMLQQIWGEVADYYSVFCSSFQNATLRGLLKSFIFVRVTTKNRMYVFYFDSQCMYTASSVYSCQFCTTLPCAYVGVCIVLISSVRLQILKENCIDV